MRCDKLQEKLDAYFAGELSRHLQGKVRTHLESCRDCRNVLARLERLASLFENTAAPAVPEGFASRVMARVHRRSIPRRYSQETIGMPVRAWLVKAVSTRIGIAAVLALGLGVGVLMGRDTWKRQDARPVASEDPSAVYRIDYLGDTPEGSLAEVYLTLASIRNGNGE